MDNVNCVQQADVYPDKAERKQIRKQYNKIGFVILINILIFNVIGIAVLYGIAALSAESFTIAAINKAKTEMLSNSFVFVLFCIGIPICSEAFVILLGSRIMGINLKKLFNFDGFNGKSVVKTATVSLGLQTATVIIASLLMAIVGLFGGEVIQPDFTLDDPSLPANIFLYMYVCLLGPVLEELLYRGVLLQSLRKYNERFAIVVSAIIFGMMHQNPTQCILGMLVGLPLAMITIKSGSIIPAIITHIIVNTSNVVFALLIMSDNNVYENMVYENILPKDGLPLLGIILSLLWRFGFLFAGIVVGVVALAKGLKMKRPTPAGKSRAWPVFMTSPIWIIVFGVYIYFVTFGSFTFS